MYTNDSNIDQLERMASSSSTPLRMLHTRTTRLSHSVPPSSTPFSLHHLLILGVFVDLTDVVDNIADSTPAIDVDSAIATAEDQLDGKFNGYKALKYLSLADGSVALTHAIQIQNEETNSWFEAFVDAHSGELLSVVDFVADFSVCSSVIHSLRS